MRSASVSEAKNKLSALLDEVKAGETVVITDRGRPVARLERIPSAVDREGRLARLERAGLLRRGTGDARAVLARPPVTMTPAAGRTAIEVIVEERRTGR